MRILLLSTLFVLQMNLLIAQEDNEIQCSHANVTQRKASTKIANALSDDYDVKFYFLDIEASNTSVFLKGKVAITAQVVSNSLSEFVVELDNALTLDSVWVDEIFSNFTHTNGEVIVNLPSPVLINETVEVTFFYHGLPPTGGFFSGISNGFAGSGNQNQVTWTLSEPLNAKDWFPCKQVLTDKADSAYIFLTVPDHLTAGSNGLLTNVVALENNRNRFEWKTKYPIAYYLLSLSIADYEEYINYANPVGSDPILIQTFLYDDGNMLNASKAVLDQVPDLIELYSEKYGLYPFHKEKYGHCTAPMGGAMEHQTMSTMNDFGFSVTAHELGHQWFGDNVTCATWRDIWVNEGFARYSEYLAYEFLQSKAIANNWMAARYENVMSATNGSVYVPEASATDPNRIFSGRLTYNKGGALIHMIRNILDDDELFFDVLSSYQHDFAKSVATGEDFKNLLEVKSGIDFDEFFNDWYYGEGYPSYKIEWNHYNDSLFVKQIQTTSHSSVNLFEVPLEYKLNFAGGDSIIRFTPSQNEESFQLYMPTVITSVSVDPENWLLKKVSKLVRNTNLKGKPVITVTGIDPEEKNSFSVYPNPATKKVNVAYKGNELFNLILTDIHGRPIINQSNIHRESEINLGALTQGIYILQIMINGSIHTQKLKIQ